jgi:wobble nucleotide-excising tRNase
MEAKVIKGISKIKGLGVFENYTKPPGTQEFGIKNLIYGWNYSGKTTLSRLFAQLESKKQNPDLVGCEFVFETDTQPITDKNFDQCGLTVRVFNSDFVKENIHFEGNSFNPILLLGKESEEAQKQIDELRDRVKKSDAARQKLDGKVDAIAQAVSSSKTEAAKNIRQLLRIDPYTAVHLGSDTTTVLRLEHPLLSEEELQKNLTLALTPDNQKPTKVQEIFTSASIDALHKEAVTVLAATPSFSNTIKHLEDNPEIETWVEKGTHFHQQEGPCEFCGNSVTKNRIEILQAHFSKDLSDHKKKIDALLLRVRAAEVNITIPKEAELNPQFRQGYKDAAAKLPTAISVFNEAIRTLADDVQRKVEAPRKLMEPAPLSEGLSANILAVVEETNLVLKENNRLADNFSTAKADAIERVKHHYVKQYIHAQAEAGYERKKTFFENLRIRLQTYSNTQKGEIERLQALISQAQLGREKINERLTSMLGSGAVQIAVVKDPIANQDRFRLVRKGGKAAKNLSDGERTAIAFSYFLTKLQELKPVEFERTIVYIDDPISSLDANHLFQVNAAIKTVFFGKNGQGEWDTLCKQFFLSTHNFQFFDLVREIDPKKQPKARLYFLRKIRPEESIFGDMPKSLRKYSSEYHFLFEEVLKFTKCQDKSAYVGLMLLPNAVRRFTELYTYSRIPVDIHGSSVDGRAEALFGPEQAKRILKVLHYFSHANNIEKFTCNNELIFDLEHAANDLLCEIQTKDPLHWKALMEAVEPRENGSI